MPFEGKNNKLVYKPVFEQRACCVQTGRDITTIIILPLISVSTSFIHIRCETQLVPSFSEVANSAPWALNDIAIHRRTTTRFWEKEKKCSDFSTAVYY
jgi:hypothetical protein